MSIGPLAELWESAPKFPLAPEVEKIIGAYVDNVTTVKREAWTKRMEEEIKAIARVSALDETSRKKLAELARQAVNESLPAWSREIREAGRALAEKDPKEMADSFATASVSDSDVAEPIRGVPEPFHHPVWLAGLRQILTPAQAAAWGKSEAQRITGLAQEIEQILGTQEDGVREQGEKLIESSAAEIRQSLPLSPERLAHLDQLAKLATDRGVAEWREQARQYLLGAEETQRRTISEQGRIFMETGAQSEIGRLAAWREGVAQFLTPEEVQQLHVAAVQRQQRRTEALAKVIVIFLDERMALSAAQRTELLPMMERLVSQTPEFFPAREPDTSDVPPAPLFVQTALRAPEEEVRRVLDADQWAHWQEMGLLAKAEGGEAKPAETEGTEPHDPEETERRVADFLLERSAEERRRVWRSINLQAEDAVRAVGLGPPAAEHLRTAAEGAAERSLAQGRAQIDEFVHGNFANANGTTFQQRLTGFGRYTWETLSRGAPAEQGIWKKAVATALNAEQRALWQRTIEERKAFREQAMAASVVASFDWRYSITAEQWAKLETRVTGILREDGGRMLRNRGNEPDAPWFLEDEAKFIPLAEVPDAELAALLGPEQWRRWSSSDEYSTARSFWQLVRAKKEPLLRAR